MDVPKSFRPKNKNLELKIKKGYSPERVNILLESCNEFIEKQKDKDFPTAYRIGRKLAKTYTYTKQDLEYLSKRIDSDCEWLGIYLSALANKVIKKEDNIILRLDSYLSCIGMNQKRGTITVKGDVLDFTGQFMEGGKIIVEGDAGEDTGRFMEGGVIEVYGKIKSISHNWIGGVILQGHKTVRLFR